MDRDRESLTEDLFKYLFKGKGSAYVEEKIIERLAKLTDENFRDAVDNLFRLNTRFGINLNDIDAILVKYLPVSRGYIHKAVEIKCDCCGHHYLWSQTASNDDSAYKNWWMNCPHCFLDGTLQASMHRQTEWFGHIPEWYLEYLDRNYRSYARMKFVPIQSQNGVKQMIERKGAYADRVEVMKLISSLENSSEERKKRF
jgi:hypothetical protein